MNVTVPIVLIEGSRLPEYKSEGAAGVDLCSTEDIKLDPLERALVGTGLRVAIPTGFEGQVRPRSGLAIQRGISMVNSPGTIDSDFRGEIKVILINLGREVVHIRQGERMGQLVICPVARAVFEERDILDGSTRGEGGFGSTG